MKEKTKKRIKGSISIFLVIIMVPMMCLSGLIVDGSRVELAKASMSSAGDLTMNSALANYDTVLKDVYGLFAMSQTAEDLEDNLYNYFVDTLMANGIITSEEDVQNNPLLQDIAGAFSGQTSNMLSMEVDKDDFTATKLKDSSLANPYILKNQIVEYQKYRAPVSSALSLLDGIASLKKILNQSSVNKAKTAVDEKSGELNETSNDLYEALKKYVDTSKNFDPGYDAFKVGSYNGVDVASVFGLNNPSKYKPAFEAVVSAYVRDLAESMPFDIVMKKNDDGTYTLEGLNVKKNNDGTCNVYCINQSLGNLYYLTGNTNRVWGYSTTATNEELLEQLQVAYVALSAPTVQNALTDIITITNLNNESLSTRRSFGLTYTIYMKKVRDVKAFYDCYKAQSGLATITFEVEVNGKKVTVTDTDITDIMENGVTLSSRLSKYKTEYDKAIRYADWLLGDLSSAIDADLTWLEDTDIEGILDDAIEKIGEVEQTVKELNEANGNLKTEIDDYNGSDAADAFSKQMAQDYEYYKDTINPEKVAALKQQLTDLKQYFSDVKAYLEGIKFIGDQVRNLTTISNMVTETKNNKTSNGETAQDYINSHIGDGLTSLTNYFKSQYVEENSKPSQMSISIDDDEFWLYLQQAFGVEGTDADKEQETLKEDLKGDAGSADDVTSGKNPVNSVNVTDEIKNLLPSQGDFIPPKGPGTYDGESDNFSSLFESISSAIGDLLEGIKKAATAGRDNLYVSEYVFDMFTYNTMEAELKIDNKITSGEIPVELLETSSGIKKSATNNYMYGAEIEYILHGDFDPDKNVKNVKQTIFCIRFLANSGYALTNAEIKSITLPPALAVQAATMGVVPYKLTQVVLQLCLALAESSNDVRLMSNGEKVALIKTSDTWVMSPQGALNTARDLAKDAVSGVVMNGAKELTGVVNDLIDKGSEKVKISADDFLNDMEIAISDQVTQLVGSAFSVFEEELVSSLDEYLKVGKSAANDAASIANNVITSADTKAKEIINGCSPTVKPIVEQFYNAYIGAKLESYKTDIKNALSDLDSVDAGSILLEVQKKISGEINSAISQLKEYVEGKTDALVDELAEKLGAKAGGYIEMGADKILEITNGYLDSTFDSLSSKLPDVAGKTSNSSSLASAIKFNYGDYLQIFLFLKLCVDDADVLTRIADVIQLNINQALTDSGYTHPKKGSFLMSEAYTYIQIEADVRLKTMFISLPFFTEYAENGGSYFKIKYKSVLGY